MFIFTPHVGVANDPTVHNAEELLLPENCVNLAKIIVEEKNVKKGCWRKFLNLYDAEKDCNLQTMLF